jgi:hypothetical protein
MMPHPAGDAARPRASPPPRAFAAVYIALHVAMHVVGYAAVLSTGLVPAAWVNALYGTGLAAVAAYTLTAWCAATGTVYVCVCARVRVCVCVCMCVSFMRASGIVALVCVGVHHTWPVVCECVLALCVCACVVCDRLWCCCAYPCACACLPCAVWRSSIVAMRMRCAGPTPGTSPALVPGRHRPLHTSARASSRTRYACMGEALFTSG